MTNYKEYASEEDKQIDISTLKADHLPDKEYANAQAHLVLACHDIILKYKGGALLIIRDNLPMKNILWPIGGRIERGMTIEESAAKKIKSECNLDVKNLKFLACSRIYSKTNPFNNSRGTDVMSFMFYGEAEGELKLDNLHKDPLILLPDQYTQEFKEKLHPFTRDFMDLAMPLIKGDNK